MRMELKIGLSAQELSVPEHNLLEVLTPNTVAIGHTGTGAVRRALARPIAGPRLSEIVKPGEKIAVITSDITRPMPTAAVMPLLLEELGRAGVKDEDVTLVFALGSHRRQTEEERRRLAGEEVYGRIRCLDSDPSDCIHLGTTRLGTPVDITRVVAEADRRICLGNIEYHYFAGYSGGAKAILPGCSTRSAIQANHRMMVLPEACAGQIDGNPLRGDLEEGASLCGVDFILNVVLDEHKEIVCAVAGDLIQAHRAGCRFLDRLYAKPIRERADIVVVSQGGAPKDLNLYQTQKALDNAKYAVKDGGTVILMGSCREGMGEKTFEEWMLTAKEPEDLIRRIQTDFQLGGHKAAAIALVRQRADISLVSELDPGLVRQLFMRPFATVQEAFDDTLKKQGPGASVIVMPYGGSTLPRVAHA